MTTTMANDEISESFADPAVQRCPYPLLEKIHREAPVYVDPKTGFYVVSRYTDVLSVTSRPEVFSNDAGIMFARTASPVADQVAHIMATEGFLPMNTLVSADPPEHTQYRALVDKAFRVDRVRVLRAGIEQSAHDLMDAFCEAGAVEYRSAFATKLPLLGIADQLGIPHSDLPQLKRWTDAQMEQINPVLPADRELAVTRLIVEMQQYLLTKIREYEAEPADNVLSDLVHTELDGRRLTHRELISIAQTIMVAGNEGSGNAIGNAVYALMIHPEMSLHLKNNPSDIGNFIEESLRYEPALPAIFRLAREDAMVGGVVVPAGKVVMISYIGANQDSDVFPNPRTFDITRKNVRRHVAFGSGIHMCIGMMLARAQVEISLRCLLERLPDAKIDPTQPVPEFEAMFFGRGLEALHLIFTPTSRLS